MNRRIAAAAVLAVWVVALAWLARRELVGTRGQLLGDVVLNVSPAATYYSLELGGQQIGVASSKVDTVPDTVRVEDLMILDVPALGDVQHIEARTEALLSRSLRLRSFRATIRGGAARFATLGTVVGDSLLELEIESADSRQTTQVALKEPIVLPALVPLHVAFGGDLEVGRTYSLSLFDPMLLDQRPVDVTVLAESTLIVVDSAAPSLDSTTWLPARWDTVHAWRVAQEVSGLRLEAWIDDLGHVVRATTPVGFTMERTAFEIAYENYRRSGGPSPTALAGSDIIRQTAIASNVSLETEELGELRVRLGGVDLAGFDLTGGRQELSGDTLIVRREAEQALDAGYRLPAFGEEVREYLKAEPLIQTTDPRIKAQARQIVGRRRDPTRAARLISEWVHDALDKRITVSVPSALEVLETRRGDCNEHTVLYVALARASGLPARTAAGLVYVRGRFYYHAWPEVFLGEWVAVDPTLGQFPADASHLRFTVGGLARQVELIRLIGRLDLDVIEARGAP
ncbi:MAG: transglutaminase family protein [Gemmatimonadales bacterium]